MFKRRIPLTSFAKLREMLWPSMGWWRTIKFYRARIVRLSSPAHSIAANMAGAAAMSFTPFFGIHIFAAMGFAWAIGAGANIVAAMVGSFVGNPWTFPFLLYTSYSLGRWILEKTGAMQVDVIVDPNFVEEHGEGLWDFLVENFHDVFVPTALGGTIMMIVSWPIYYYIFFYLVRGAQRARKLRIKRKQMRAFRNAADRRKK
jgi:hypothetical protein